MKKKFIILITLFAITTGCTVNYEVTLDENLLKETLEVTEKQENMNENILTSGSLTAKEFINNIYTLPQPVYNDADVDLYEDNQIIEGVEYYEKEIISSENKYGIQIKYNHSIDKFDKSNIINHCYKNISVLKNGDTITLSTSRNNLCFEKYKNLDEINIYLNFDSEKYAVISHNADQLESGKYYWKINKSNYNDKSIVIELEEKITVEEENAITVLIGFMIVVGIISSIVLLVGMKNNKRKNEV